FALPPATPLWRAHLSIYLGLRQSRGLPRCSNVCSELVEPVERLTVSLVNHLRHVQRLRKPAAVHPVDAVPDLKTRVLDSARHPVIGAGTAEREQMTARLEDAQALGPELDAVGDAGVVPALAHEPELVGRV